MRDYEAEIKKIKRQNYTAFAIVVILVAAILISLLVGEIRSGFTTKRWMENPDERTRIVDDLLEEHDLMGMHREDIERLLGEDTFGDSTMAVYYLGPERGFISIDSEWLVIEYKGELAVNYYITTD